ncbi:MAG: thiolase domain-containing protein [Chloroflexi bacterium]|nr:thiolase domain-containing protein [Chloroflexota bacterium]
MREVAVLGIGQTKVEEHWDKSLRELAGEAVLTTLSDAGVSSVDALYVGNMLSGASNRQQHLGAYIADWVGLKNIEAIRFEAACSSGSAAFRSALMAVASGEVDTAIAVGVEKMTDVLPAEMTKSLATAADAEYEGAHGLSFVALNALIMKRYMYEYGWKHEDFAGFSINSHANAVHNPYARFRKPITEQEFIKAVVISEPINILDASPVGDGSAAVLLVPLENLQKSPGKRKVKVAASATATDSIAIHSRNDPLWLSAAEKSAKEAYRQAGIGPEDIDVFELHDAFSIMAALSLEACGFAERGRGPELAKNGDITLHGRIPICTLGGLKSRGHPVGATGIYQIVEVVEQLRQEAGPAQVQDARYGMAQNIGGSGSNIFTHIFEAL